MSQEKWSKNERLFFIREWTFNLLVAMFFFYFAANHIRYYMATRSSATLLFIGFEIIIVVLALARRMPKDVSFRSVDWIAAGVGTYLPLAFVSNGIACPGAGGILIMQFIGVSFSFIGILSLNRCFAIVPSNRGIQTGGLYRFVRHPVYTGYFVSLTCFILQNNSLRNYAILIITFIAMVVRVVMEERILMKDPAYQDLARRTKWRIFPGIW